MGASLRKGLDISLGDALTSRRSIRGYKKQNVAAKILQDVFEAAQKAPSNCNTQPWSVFVASGEVRDELSRRLLIDACAGVKPVADFHYYDKFSGAYRERQVDCAMELYRNMGVERQDKKARQKAMLRNYEFFGAPHVAYICMPKQFDVGNALDVGIYVQTLMLVMRAYGLSCCAQGALTFFTAPARTLLGIDDSLGIVVGISFGYGDDSEPANSTQTARESIDNVVTFLDEF